MQVHGFEPIPIRNGRALASKKQEKVSFKSEQRVVEEEVDTDDDDDVDDNESENESALEVGRHNIAGQLLRRGGVVTAGRVSHGRIEQRGRNIRPSLIRASVAEAASIEAAAAIAAATKSEGVVVASSIATSASGGVVDGVLSGESPVFIFVPKAAVDMDRKFCIDDGIVAASRAVIDLGEIRDSSI